jgi:hypothetical protein
LRGRATSGNSVQFGLSIGTVITAALCFVETLAYLFCARWYFRLGPALHREEWQTRATPSEVRGVVGRALRHSRLVARRRGDVFCFRRPIWAMSAWPRVALRMTDGAEGVILVYEVRPFITMALVAIIGVGWLLARTDQIYWAISTAFIIVTYGAFWRHELNVLARLRALRACTREIGLRICTRCGYDLYGRPADQPCPECGAAEP